VSEVDRGWKLFGLCMEHRGAIGGAAAPAHVANGSFHMLADRPIDKLPIGWHPRFRDLLRTEQ
jgi:hypothetical protein